MRAGEGWRTIGWLPGPAPRAPSSMSSPCRPVQRAAVLSQPCWPPRHRAAAIAAATAPLGAWSPLPPPSPPLAAPLPLSPVSAAYMPPCALAPLLQGGSASTAGEHLAKRGSLVAFPHAAAAAAAAAGLPLHGILLPCLCKRDASHCLRVAGCAPARPHPTPPCMMSLVVRPHPSAASTCRRR